MLLLNSYFLAVLQGMLESLFPDHKSDLCPLHWKLSLSFIFGFLNFNWDLIKVLLWFLPYTDMSQPPVCMCSPSRTPYPIPLGCPSALALSALFHASNLDWQSISHMAIYIFQCYPSNQPTLAFSHRVQVSSLHLCLFCCLTYRIIVTIFLNYIYMH